VTSWAAVLIGTIAGVLVVESILFIERRLKVDDPVGAISVHAVNGLWGVLSLGLFADGTYGDGYNGVAGGIKGLLYGDGHQFIAQVIGPVVNIMFVGASFYLIYKLVDATIGHRVSAEAEIAGLDLPEMGALAYPDFQISSSAAAPGYLGPISPAKPQEGLLGVVVEEAQ
jgi:Amt family ammonium transporter